ncbi:molybdenum cofactor guanylyltransferase MobA [Herbaspirillum sp. RTI4]|uniref:molybdenum cofactor guanylyltransferase MobA n=1 Tax=Herbaspirillum sp. RTI4 TaxID=3048640 RepID=UPI002AB3BA85|nr:molybdenum cofactor guanylyltransferase MobA [Herbaspirillum sp. RTI4]MDY7579228.1 molybdenum cofactor guanylyltransferase MobA [Herbaspirillum sp. RTI4]MEA9982639.1 molybdenum cofactor guanylyltransferase MobA [Herbaspirillum sp. RTI4]
MSATASLATNQTSATIHISGLILSGGRGTRMGEVDKGLQAFNGEPMVAQIIRRFAPQVAHLAINANQNLTQYQAFGLDVLPDHMPDFAGPLAGLQTGLMQCRTPLLATAPCDSPFLPHDLVSRLYRALTQADAELALAVTDDASRRQRHPVFCLLQTDLLPRLTQFLDHGGRRMNDWFATLATVEVPFPDATAFSNINTRQELAALESLSATAPPP